MLLSKARITGEHITGLALDWSKCYDRLPLGILTQVAAAAGVPEAISRPMFHAYGLPRLVKSEGAASVPEQPTHGLAPGCPAATDWLALLVFCWKAKVNSIDDQTAGRD